ncbi:hypothetical protein HZC20_00840, partial [Candidatus Peregrinibacteria bacterium]|nr:hypothetical protein [Candidatus Peregrinibacteria bacterium]
IPRTLIENAGLDPIDIMTELKSAHAKKQRWAGIDVFTGKINDSWKRVNLIISRFLGKMEMTLLFL